METIINAKPRQPTMTIAYEKGEQVITHPAGVVCKYNAADLKQQRDRIVELQARLATELAVIDKTLADAAKTADIKPVEEPIEKP